MAVVTAWVGIIAVFTLDHIAMEAVMKLSAKAMCAAKHVTAWDRDGTLIRACNGAK